MLQSCFSFPPPDFRAGELRTTALLFAHQEFADMSKGDWGRACYQHCCLMHVTNQRMSKQPLRLRFGLGEDKTVLTSQVIGAAKEAGLIWADESETTSTRYARYLPFWAWRDFKKCLMQTGMHSSLAKNLFKLKSRLLKFNSHVRSE